MAGRQSLCPTCPTQCKALGGPLDDLPIADNYGTHRFVGARLTQARPFYKLSIMDPKENVSGAISGWHDVQEKTMKITEALYRTTDLFSDVEPLKWSLRESAVKILSTVNGVGDHPTYSELCSLRSLGQIIASISAQLNLASGGAFVARSNFEVLEREYQGLKSNLANRVNSEAPPALPMFSAENAPPPDWRAFQRIPPAHLSCASAYPQSRYSYFRRANLRP